MPYCSGRTHPQDKKGDSRRGRYHGPPWVVAGLVLPRARGRFRRHACRKFFLFNGKPVLLLLRYSCTRYDTNAFRVVLNTATATAERTVFVTTTVFFVLLLCTYE